MVWPVTTSLQSRSGVYLTNTRYFDLEGQSHGTAYIAIGSIGGIHSAFSADTRNVVRYEASRVLETAFLSLFLEKATRSFQPQAFRGRMTAWSGGNDRSWPFAVVHSTFPGRI